MKNKKTKLCEKSTADEHLMHVYKNTTALDRLQWLKRQIDFMKKIRKIRTVETSKR